MKTNKKEIASIECKRKKAELEKQLNAIKEIEKEEQARKIDEFIKLVQPEIDALLPLCNFYTKGKIQVELTYDIGLSIYLMDSGNQESLVFDGDCDISKIKEPKGYQIAQFVAEDCFGNMGIDEPQDLVAIHPEIKKHLEKYKKAKTALLNKISKVAKKLDIDEQYAIEVIEESMSQ